MIVDAADTIELVNLEAERLFGYDRDELLGRPIEILVPERFRPQHAREAANYLTAPRARPMGIGVESWARRRDGTEVPVEISSHRSRPTRECSCQPQSETLCRG